MSGEPTYKAILKTVAFDSQNVTATYDFTPDERAEVVLTLAFDAKSGKGKWLLREKGSNTEVATGTLALSKK